MNTQDSERESWCLHCGKFGHFTHECHSTRGVNTPAARELERLCEIAARSHLPSEAAQGGEGREADYDAGWRAAASWAHRYDLTADMDSPAYISERAARLLIVVPDAAPPAQPAEAVEPTARPDEWKEAVLDQLTNTAQDFPLDTPPAEIMHAIIQWHVRIALDPAVSSEAQALIDSGRAARPDSGLVEALRKAARVVEIVLFYTQNGARLGDEEFDEAYLEELLNEALAILSSAGVRHD